MNLFRLILFLFQIHLSLCSYVKLQGPMEKEVINAVNLIWSAEKIDVPKIYIKANQKFQ